MIYCKRCSMAYIRGDIPIEKVSEGKLWIPAENNELWLVCDTCAGAIMYANRALFHEDPKQRLERRKKMYEESKEGKP